MGGSGKQRLTLVDGGLATRLEARGYRVDDSLWSARVLADDPLAVLQVHRDYLHAGADVITSASYQVSFEGCARHGFTSAAVEELLRRSVRLARKARTESRRDRQAESRTMWVAASVGPYGAVLADGSEYRGDYSIGRSQLRAFHRRRWEILADCGADLMACETIPSASESEVLVDLLRETPGCRAWLAFSCRDDAHISDGTPIEEAIAPALDCERVVAVGVNCTAPAHITGLVERLRAVTDRDIIAYPNRGGHYDPLRKSWDQPDSPIDWGKAVGTWIKAGATWVGGCCGCDVEQIRRMRTVINQLTRSTGG